MASGSQKGFPGASSAEIPFSGRQTLTFDVDLFSLSAINLANSLFSSAVVRMRETCKKRKHPLLLMAKKTQHDIDIRSSRVVRSPFVRLSPHLFIVNMNLSRL